jgi:hypothetical protein
MEIRNERLAGGRALRVIEGAAMANAIGVMVTVLGAGLLIAYFGEPLRMFVGTVFVAAGGWGLWVTAHHETVADDARRTLVVERRSRALHEIEEIGFDEMTAIEYHDRRVHPRWGGKSYIAFLVAARLKDGRRVSLSSDWGFYRGEKRQAAEALARFIGLPCTIVREDE